MTIETLIGFDCAWTDNNPGAISMITHNQGKLVDFMPPRLVRFEEATEMVQRAASASDFTLIALDQPTLVPSFEGMRPVERVVGSVVNAIGGGVQPANRSRESMFGQGAPVWQFLDRVGARENPAAATEALHGLFLIEVFPALALASIIRRQLVGPVRHVCATWLTRSSTLQRPDANGVCCPTTSLRFQRFGAISTRGVMTACLMR